MKSYEFTRYYNPQSGRFVFRHKGTGLIVDYFQTNEEGRISRFH